MNKDIVIKESEVMEGTVLESLTSLTRQTISGIVARKAELKDKKEKLNQILLQNTEYHRAVDSAKEIAKLKAAARNKALKNPEAAQLNDEVKGIRMEVKEKQLALFDYLFEYHRQTNATEITDNTGEQHQIVIEAKIKI